MKCTFYRMLADLTFWSGGDWRMPSDRCPESPVFEVQLGIPGGDGPDWLTVTRACAEHETALRARPEWRTSEPITLNGATR